MQREIRGISYIVRNNARSRSVSLRIHGDGSIHVSKHRRISLEYVEKLLERKFDWIQEKVREQAQKPQKLLAHYSAADFRIYKNDAYDFALKRLAHFNATYQFKIGQVSIRNQKSRWGSCSSRGNINFNYKIVLLPPDLADYIIVHELCHLGEMNHGASFWNLVAKTIPNYLTRRKSIRLF